MSFIAWIAFGLVAGFIASRIVNRRGSGLAINVILGVFGSMVGGMIFNFFGAAGVTGFNVRSLVVAVFGAILVLAAYHAISGRRTT